MGRNNFLIFSAFLYHVVVFLNADKNTTKINITTKTLMCNIFWLVTQNIVQRNMWLHSNYGT